MIFDYLFNYVGVGVEQKVSQQQHSMEKLSDASLSLASAYPNGVMGIISLVAGVIWFFVNKSATPVIKMRSGQEDNGSSPSAARTQQEQLDWVWLSLQDVECQRRAICDVVSEYPSLVPLARFIESSLRSVSSHLTIDRTTKCVNYTAIHVNDNHRNS